MIVAPDVFLLTFVIISAIRIAAGRNALDLRSLVGIPFHNKPAGMQRLAPQRAPQAAAITLRNMEPARPAPVRIQHAQTPAKSRHIDALKGIVTGAVDRARSAEQFHRSAHEQVDAAHYALQNLLDELSAVMPIAKASRPQRTSAARGVRQQAHAGFETALAA